MKIDRAIVLLTVLVLAGCAVGLDYRPPEPTVTGDWIEPVDADAGDAAGLTGWWRDFSDPLLAKYAELALQANHDVRVAEARLREARALRRVAGSTRLPQLDAGASYTGYTLSKNSPAANSQAVQGGLSDRSDELYEARFDASWELDVFGGNRRRTEAASARADASLENLNAVRLSIVAEVTRNFVELRGIQKRIENTRANADFQRQTVDLARKRLESGLSPELDALRAEAQLEATLSFIPELDAAFRQTAYRLAVLTGRAPEETLAELSVVRPVPQSTRELKVGLRGEILRNRPDVRAAERELAAASADIGVAVSDLYPKFVLSGQLGLESSDTSSFAEGDSRSSAILGVVSLPLFNGGRLRALVDAAEARNEAQAAVYEQTVLRAVEEAEAALARYSRAQNSRDHLQKSVAAQDEAAEIARRLYGSGLSDFLSVLDAERRRLETEDALIRRETEVVVTLVALYKALGVI